MNKTKRKKTDHDIKKPQQNVTDIKQEVKKKQPKKSFFFNEENE